MLLGLFIGLLLGLLFGLLLTHRHWRQHPPPPLDQQCHRLFPPTPPRTPPRTHAALQRMLDDYGPRAYRLLQAELRRNPHRPQKVIMSNYLGALICATALYTYKVLAQQHIFAEPSRN